MATDTVKKKELKVCLMGDCGVGKTSLLYRISRDIFDPAKVRNTIVCDFFRKQITVGDQDYELVLWEMAGSERFIREIPRIFGRGVCACLLVFALDDKESFKSLNEWLSDFKEKAPIVNEIQSFPLILVGNKDDLDKDSRCVDREAIDSWCQNNGLIPYIPTSAKTGVGVFEAFETAARQFHGLDDTIKDQLLDNLPLVTQDNVVCQQQQLCSC